MWQKHSLSRPGDYLNPGEDDMEGLKRRLDERLAPPSGVAGQFIPSQGAGNEWEIGDCLAQWWRPNFETFMVSSVSHWYPTGPERSWKFCHPSIPSSRPTSPNQKNARSSILYNSQSEASILILLRFKSLTLASYRDQRFLLSPKTWNFLRSHYLNYTITLLGICVRFLVDLYLALTRHKDMDRSFRHFPTYFRGQSSFLLNRTYQHSQFGFRYNFIYQ